MHTRWLLPLPAECWDYRYTSTYPAIWDPCLSFRAMFYCIYIDLGTLPLPGVKLKTPCISIGFAPPKAHGMGTVAHSYNNSIWETSGKSQVQSCLKYTC